jgi:hypothetical protein
MKVSGFVFLRNGRKLGNPFVASIRSLLPIGDEFFVAPSPCDDDTEKMVRDIGDPKIRIIPTQWNGRIQPSYSVNEFVYGQQKNHRAVQLHGRLGVLPGGQRGVPSIFCTVALDAG